MQKSKFDAMLRDVARFEGVSVKEAYQLLQETINAAQQNPDPMVQLRWKKIPHKGDRVTVEEFFAYMEQMRPTDGWWNTKGKGAGPLS